jgi:dolichol-phosphate mannosyltransferase
MRRRRSVTDAWFRHGVVGRRRGVRARSGDCGPFAIKLRLARADKLVMPNVMRAARKVTTPSTVRAATGFAGVGLAGIGVNQLVLTGLVHTGATDYLIAAVLATQAAIIFNFVMLERWVFSRGSADELGGRLARYWALSNVFLVLGLPVLALLVSGLHVHYALANLAVIGLQFGLRFLVSHRVIWRSPDVAAASAASAA